MLLRWLVNNYLREAAQGKLQSVVMETLRGVNLAAAAGEQAKDAAPPPLAPPCDVAFIFALGIESGGLVDKLSGSSAAKCKTFLEHSGTMQGKEVVIAESNTTGNPAADGTAKPNGLLPMTRPTAPG